MNPADKILLKLLEGNRRFVAAQSKGCFSDQNDRRVSLMHDQKPTAIILGCSDSRVPPEILFDQGIGDLFIIRVAGNVLGPSEVDSITYAVKMLECPLLVVLGHENCGAINAVMTGNADIIPYIKKEIMAAIDCHGEPCVISEQVKNNVLHIVGSLKKIPQLAEDVNSQRLKVVGAFYPFISGEVELLS